MTNEESAAILAEIDRRNATLRGQIRLVLLRIYRLIRRAYKTIKPYPLDDDVPF